MLALLNIEPLVSPKSGAQQRESGFAVGQADREILLRWVRAATTPQRVVMRSAVVLLSALGWSPARIAGELGVTRRTVATWRARYASGGTASLLVDAPGRGRKPGRDQDMVARILGMVQQAPPRGRRWTLRTLARATGVSHATVQRVLRERAAGWPAGPRISETA